MSITSRTHNGKKQYRFTCYYTAPDGSRKKKASKWYSTQKDAKKAEVDFLSGNTQGKTAKFEEIYKDWLNSLVVEDSTKREKKGIVENHFKLWFNMDIAMITPAMIRKRFQEPDIVDLATITKNKYRTNLNQIFTFAKRYYGLQENPIDKVETFKAPRQVKELSEFGDVPIYSPDEFKTFIAAMETLYNDDYANIFQYIYWLGFRRSEALSITFGDVRDGKLYIWRSWDVHTRKWKVLKTESSRRIIKLPNGLVDIYNEQLEKYQNCEGFNAEWFLFGGFEPLTRATMDRRRKAAEKYAGLHYVTNHQMRHSYVSNMMSKEDNAFKVGASVGHKDGQVTRQVYSHVTVNDFSKDIDEMMKPDIKA